MNLQHLTMDLVSIVCSDVRMKQLVTTTLKQQKMMKAVSIQNNTITVKENVLMTLMVMEHVMN